MLIGDAGGAAHLPGMLAAATVLPVIGLPVPLARLDALDSLLSIVQMPAGKTPVWASCATTRPRAVSRPDCFDLRRRPAHTFS